MIEAFAPDDPRWDAVVEDGIPPDVYFRRGYCRAYDVAGHGRAVAVATEGGFFPLLLRPLPFGADGHDAITPYGYGGMMLRAFSPVADHRPSDELRRLRHWCVTNGVVSVLLRLHPLAGGRLDVSDVDEADADVREHGPTTALELSRVEDGRLRGMSKGRKADLNVAARAGVEVVWRRDAEALERFRAVYDDTMRRIGAGEFYFFPPEYYAALSDGLGDRLGVALAVRGDDVVGGALFLDGGRWAHYHLSGTTEAGRELKAGTLLVHEGALWARERGCELLHLGGGTSGSDGDSLFAFKKSFGGETYTYRFATLVADRERYDELVARRADEPEPPRADFFPAYRA